MTVYEKLGLLIELMGEKSVLDDLAKALDNDTLRDCLEYIARMHDIDL